MQIEKEALSMTWACEWFRGFLMGIKFHMETDHKPLLPFLGSKNLDEPRTQHFLKKLMRFQFLVTLMLGKLAIADMLSGGLIPDES